MRSAAIVLAAGAGERLGSDEPKAFVELGGRSLVRIAVEAAQGSVDDIVVAVADAWLDRAAQELSGMERVNVCAGGPTRRASVRAALEVVPEEADVIVCHDAARPFAGSEMFDAVIAALAEADGAIPVLPVDDTVKVVADGVVERTLDRSMLALAQTPQAFIATSLRDAHARADAAGIEVTDDSAALEWAGYLVRVIPGDPGNFKITSQADLTRAREVIASV